MTLSYSGQSIDIISFDNFILSSTLENDEDITSIRIVNNSSNTALFQVPYQDCIIDHDSVNYYFYIAKDPVFNENTIDLKLTSKVRHELEKFITTTFNKTAYNPVTAIQELLTTYGFDMDDYSFEIAKDRLSDNSVTMDCVAIIEKGNQIKIIDFCNEVLKRCCMKLVIDYSTQKIKIHDYLKDYLLTDFSDIISADYIDINKRVDKESKDFYNSFSIGVYPLQYARMVFEYNYEVYFETYGTFNIHESDIKVITDLTINQLVQLKYDRKQTGLFIPAGTYGRLTGNRTLWSTALLQTTIDNGLYSQRVLYGTETEPFISQWKDEKSNNNFTVARHTNLTGAFKIGNSLIQKYYKKRKQIEMVYPPYFTFKSGDLIYFENTKFILLSAKINNIFWYELLLEEVL